MPTASRSRYTRIAMLLVLLVATRALGQGPKRHITRKDLDTSRIIDVQNDSSFLSLVSNSRLRAFRLELAPSGSTRLDRHDHDYLVLAITPVIMRVAKDLSGYDLHVDAGEMQVIKGGWVHRIVNQGTTQATLVVVECRADIQPESARCGLGAPACSDGRFASNENGQYTSSTLFDTPAVTLSKVILGPGSTLPSHSHSAPHLMIALSDLHLAQTTADATTEFVQQPGGTAWFDPGFNHLLKNETTHEARFLVLEVKSAPASAAK